MNDHYTDGRRWSYIHNAWVLVSSWNDKEELAKLRAEIARLQAQLAAAKKEV